MTINECVFWIFENRGKKVGEATLRNWTVKGVRGRVLKTHRSFGKIVVEEADLIAFLDDVDGGQSSAVPIPPKPDSDDARAEAAEEELRKNGINVPKAGRPRKEKEQVT